MTREEFLFDISDLPKDGYKTLHKILSDHDDEQRAEIERLQAQLAGWKELEGKDIYQYCVDLRGTIRDLKAQLAPNG